MKVLDATYLTDYLDGLEAAREFYEESGDADVRWVMPVPAFAEVLIGEGNLTDALSVQARWRCQPSRDRARRAVNTAVESQRKQPA